MTKRWLLVLLVALMGGVPVGCSVDADDDDDDVELKVDNEGDERGVTIDSD